MRFKGVVFGTTPVVTSTPMVGAIPQLVEQVISMSLLHSIPQLMNINSSPPEVCTTSIDTMVSGAGVACPCDEMSLRWKALMAITPRECMIRM